MPYSMFASYEAAIYYGKQNSNSGYSTSQ